MNNRNQQTARATAPAEAPAPTLTYLNVFTVEEYESNGKTSKSWTKVGAAFPHKDGVGSILNSRRCHSTEGSSRCLPTRMRTARSNPVDR